MHVRRARTDEWKALREVRLAALADSPDAFGSTLAEERHADEARWRGWITGDGWDGTVATFVADDDGTLVGMATGYQADEEPEVVWLFAMWVVPSRRGHGIGRGLVSAVGFYSSCGFVGTHHAGEPLRDGSDLLTHRMRLLLGERWDADLLRSQRAYYDDRAPEYEDLWFRRGEHDRGPEVNERWFRETAALEASLASVDASGDVLELACGTGVLTRLLAPRARSLVALDASTRSLEINRSRIADPRVRYIHADLFEWETDERFDLIVAGFFVSHVLPSSFEEFWTRMGRWLRPGGRVWLADDTATPVAPRTDVRTLGAPLHAHRRELGDRPYTIVKLFYTAEDLTGRLNALGWKAELHPVGEHFLAGTARPVDR